MFLENLGIDATDPVRLGLCFVRVPEPPTAPLRHPSGHGPLRELCPELAPVPTAAP